MNIWNIFTYAVVIGCLSSQASFAVAAQDEEPIYGTHSVEFQPGQSSGRLHSCMLVYRVTQADYAYRNGSPIMIDGNIGIRQFDAKKMLLTLKIGVMDIGVPDALYTRPYFAYLQTPNATTAKSRCEIGDGDEGFRLITMGLDDITNKLLFEMLESGKVTLGFNRKKDGLDVLVPIDLKVLDTKYPDSGKIARKRSDEAITQFLGCYKELLGQGI